MTFVRELLGRRPRRDDRVRTRTRAARNQHEQQREERIDTPALVRDGELTEYKAVRNPIGLYPKLKPFETEELQAEPGDYLYMFSDGFADQFNGATGKKVTYGRFRALLCDINKETSQAAEQQQRLNDFFNGWRADFVQMDDVLIGGFRVK